MIRLTSRQWALATCGLWLCLLVNLTMLDGLPRVIVGLAIVLGFLALAAERWQNWHEQAAARRRA